MDTGWAKSESVLRDAATVAVHEAPTEIEAQDVASLLLAAGIPAALEPANTTTTWVVVPWERQRDADAVLKRLSVPVIPRFAHGGLEGDLGVRAVFTWAPELHDTATTTSFTEGPRFDEEGEDTEVERELPDSGPLMPRLILALSAIGFGVAMQRALETLLGPGGAISALAASPARALEFWRYLTAGFMHFGIAHYLSNAIFGVLIGVVLFGTHGAGAAMIAWIVSTVVGISAETLFSPDVAWIAGASAGNYGLVGLWAKGQLDRSRVSLLPRRERLRTMGVLLILVPGALTPVTGSGSRVAVMAHAAGFVAGFLVGYVFERKLLPETFLRIERRSKIAQWVAVGLVLAALGAAGWVSAS